MTVAVLFPLVFLVIGIGVLLWTGWDVVSALRSRRWPQVDGTIVVSDLQRSKDSEGGFMYRPEVTYRYSIDGKEYTGSRTRYGDWLQLSWSKPAVKTVRRYAVGTAVAVRYDPRDPEDSVLEPGVHGVLFGCLVFGAMFAIFGILGVRSAM